MLCINVTSRGFQCGSNRERSTGQEDKEGGPITKNLKIHKYRAGRSVKINVEGEHHPVPMREESGAPIRSAVMKSAYQRSGKTSGTALVFPFKKKKKKAK